MTKLYCCENCFYDSYLKDRVREEGELGDCDFCESTEVYHIEPKELASDFYPVVELYTPVEDFMPMHDIKQGRGDMLWDKLQENWSIFTFEDYGKQEDLLLAMFPGDDYKMGPPHFLTSLVESEIEFWGEHYEASHKMEKEWNEFTEEIKYKNRFFPQKQLELDFLKNLLTFIEYTITPEIELFRSRKTVDEKRLAPGEMGKPPSEKAKNSRANPKGISYLYLASDAETAISEIRPSINDNVTVGNFEIIDSLLIINLRNPSIKSPFGVGDDLQWVIKYMIFLGVLGIELSKPINSSVGELEYLPSQFLCEFIKNAGYDGVAYRSSLADGYNLAIFNDEKLRCTKTKMHKIKKIHYDT